MTTCAPCRQPIGQVEYEYCATADSLSDRVAYGSKQELALRGEIAKMASCIRDWDSAAPRSTSQPSLKLCEMGSVRHDDGARHTCSEVRMPEPNDQRRHGVQVRAAAAGCA
jgi:hypothetical protein